MSYRKNNQERRRYDNAFKSKLLEMQAKGREYPLHASATAHALGVRCKSGR